MKRPDLGRLIVLTLILGLLGLPALFAYYFILGNPLGFSFILTMLCGVYGWSWFVMTGVRKGRLSYLFFQAGLAVFAVIMPPGMVTMLALNLVGIWVVRSACCYAGPFSSLMDGALVIVGWMVALWAFGQTGSLIGAIWFFLLVQCLQPLIPSSWRPVPQKLSKQTPPDPFERAMDDANKALRRIAMPCR